MSTKRVKEFVDSVELSVPAELGRRQELRRYVAEYVEREQIRPPLTVEELSAHVLCLESALDLGADELSYTTVMLHNAVWGELVSAIPYERRLLLLPQCLSHTPECPAERDALGLLCAQCGRCAIGTLQEVADRLGYVTLVAEGTTVVSKLLISGKVDGVIGVGCLESLKRIFPVMTANAIPGQGIPLLKDGCVHTEIDLEWAEEIIRARSRGSHEPVNPEQISAYIESWFTREALEELLGRGETEAQRVGVEWLLTGGKRWRPMLTTAVYKTLGGNVAEIHSTVVAVECFHKASLIHDDIEDGDDERYGEPTVHRRYGVPAAINAGDYLIGEGYRLVAQSGFDAEQRIAMTSVVAEGHRKLCLGQGEDLAFCREPRPVSESEVMRIYERKTAAAFEVAVLTAAVAAGASQTIQQKLSEFSRAIGIAYQIRDDIEDFTSTEGRAADLLAMRPTLHLAIACCSDNPEVQRSLCRVWSGSNGSREELIRVIDACGVHERVNVLFKHYRHEAERVLAEFEHTGLRQLLRRILTRMLCG